MEAMENPKPNPSKHDQFMQLFLANQRRVYGLILTLVPNFSDADDLLQETSSLMWRKFDEFRPGSDFGAWGAQIARYEIANFRRKQPRTASVDFSDELVDTLAAEAEQALQLLDARRDALRHCMERLPGSVRQAIELRYAPGATVKSVAARLDKSVDAIYKALNRAHLDLQHCVERRVRLGEQA